MWWFIHLCLLLRYSTVRVRVLYCSATVQYEYGTSTRYVHLAELLGRPLAWLGWATLPAGRPRHSHLVSGPPSARASSERGFDVALGSARWSTSRIYSYGGTAPCEQPSTDILVPNPTPESSVLVRVGGEIFRIIVILVRVRAEGGKPVRD